MSAIGVDIGGTKLAIGRLENDELTDYEQVPLPTKDYQALVADVVQRVSGFPDGTSVGVAMASWLSADREEVLQAVNLGWDHVSLRSDIEKATGLPTVVENDGNCAAWAEYLALSDAAGESFVLLTLGTDVGGGVVAGQRLITGAHGMAGELGHLDVGIGNAPCVCGARGCLAAYASGNAIVAEARRQVGIETAEAFTRSVRTGNTDSLAILDRAAYAVAVASAQISRVIDHSHLVLGGGVSALGAHLTEAVGRHLAHTHPVGPIHPRPTVSIASTGNRAGVIGAAHLAAALQKEQ